MGRSHLVILGAGASRAAFPNGDRNGIALPTMNDLVEVVGLKPLIQGAASENDTDNFEISYSQIYEVGNTKLLGCLESAIHDYFSKMRLPDELTIYDQLVLSLRSKDIIATFNWDPLLFLALQRNHLKADLPKAAFLHGNVALGYCRDDWLVAVRGAKCPKCGKPLTDTRLLYPISKKGYNQDHFIWEEWKKLRRRFENAFVITIFGYSAPNSDVEAVDLMKTAWDLNNAKSLAQIEIIDIMPEDTVRERWDSFIVDTHYDVYRDYFDSFIARYPRRSCEAMWAQVMEGVFLEERALTQHPNWDEFNRYINRFIEVEKAQSKE